MNTPAHLVARALRDRRTVTYQHASGGGYWRFGMTRSQILRDVRLTPEGGFIYGVEYDASRPTTNDQRYGLDAYRQDVTSLAAQTP